MGIVLDDADIPYEMRHDPKHLSGNPLQRPDHENFASAGSFPLLTLLAWRIIDSSVLFIFSRFVV